MRQNKSPVNKEPAEPLFINLMTSSMATSELLSALADGQLDDADLDVALHACGSDDSALECWNTYHLIGDLLRSPARSSAPLAADSELAFVGRLSQRLAQEPQVSVQPETVEKAVVMTPVQPAIDLIHHRGPASNDGNFRWKLVAGVTSLAAVSAIAWSASGLLTSASPPQLAQASSSPQIVVTSPQGLMVRDARLEELLAAHKQFGATSALQESSGFLRNATFDLPQQDAQAAGGR